MPLPGTLQGLRTEELAQSLSLEREEGGGRYNRQPLPDFEREKDFLQMLPSLTGLDPNDPRNANLLRFRDMVLPSEALYNRFRTAEHCFQLCFAAPQGLLVDYRCVTKPPPSLELACDPRVRIGLNDSHTQTLVVLAGASRVPDGMNLFDCDAESRRPSWHRSH